MGKTKNTSGLLETMEETKDEISNAQSIRIRVLESHGTSHEQKRLLANGKGTQPSIFKENNSQARIYIHA